MHASAHLEIGHRWQQFPQVFRLISADASAFEQLHGRPRHSVPLDVERDLYLLARCDRRSNKKALLSDRVERSTFRGQRRDQIWGKEAGM